MPEMFRLRLIRSVLRVLRQEGLIGRSRRIRQRHLVVNGPQKLEALERVLESPRFSYRIRRRVREILGQRTGYRASF